MPSLYNLSPLGSMMLVGALLALGPLLWVGWRQRHATPLGRLKALTLLTLFLTFDLVLFGAFTRLTDSGLGCPDWPGCYGLANPFQAHEAIRAAQDLMPDGPVTLFKAWVEMTHRYLAMGIGVLILAMMAHAWRQWRQWRKSGRPELSPWLPTALFLFVCLQGAFGAWTVTQKLQPLIVTIHLLLGMGLLALLTWLGGRQDHAVAPAPRGSASVARRVASHAAKPAAGLGQAAARQAMAAMRVLAAGAALLLLVQIALGGWVSTNYATLACSDFPLCDGQLVPDMDFGHGFTLWRALGKTAAGHYLPFSALTAIHWVHRSFALVVLAGIGYTAWRAGRHASLRPTARAIALVLLLQAGSGIATIFLNYPLAIAVLHNGGAALLVVLLTMLNYRAKFLFEMAGQAAGPSSPARPHP